MPVPRGGRRHARGAYTKKDRVLSIVATEMMGTPEASKVLAITQRQLQAWRADPEMEPYIRATRERVLEDATTAAALAWGQTVTRLVAMPDSISDRDMLNIATNATETMQLLSGGATSRAETIALTESFDEAETRKIVDAARKYLLRHGPGARPRLVTDGRVEAPAQTGADASAG